MDHPKRTFSPIASIICALLGALLATGCGDKTTEPIKEEEQTSYFKVAPVKVAELHRNQLAQEPTDFLRSRAGDLIHWQPWSPALLGKAKLEQKLVFAVVGNGRYPECGRLLDSLGKKPALIEILHGNYVCTLIDTDLHPEMAIQVAMLSSEINRRISFPAMIWMSHEGCPVAWLPLTANDVDEIDEVFGNSDAMVSRIWRDSSLYVIQNSRRDNDARLERQRPELADPDAVESLTPTVNGALRRLSSLYDPGTGNIDGGGGLVPSALWRLAGTAALSPRTNTTVAERMKAMLEGNTDLLLRSAVRDPLDDGFFSARRSTGWDLPVFMKTADAQSQMALGLAKAAALLESPRHLDAAREVLEFAQDYFGAEGDGLGVYESAPGRSVESLAYLWSQDVLREFLTPEELAVATVAYEISGMGNIPPESDPKRDFFRKNSLGAKANIDEIAAKLGMEDAEVAPLLDAVRRRLVAQREEVLGRGNAPFVETARLTATNARYATAAAEFAAVSGDARWLERAQTLLKYIESKHRAPDGSLWRLATSGNRRAIPARAEDYAAMLEAQLAVYRLDLDAAHLTSAMELVEMLLKHHRTGDGFLTEAPLKQQVGDTPTYSSRMIFGDSTWGSLFGPLIRLHQLTGNAEIEDAADTILRAMLAQLDPGSPTNDLIHTDFLNNAQIRLADTLVYLEGTPGTPEFDALHAVLRDPAYWMVTPLHLGDALPAGFSAGVPAAGQVPIAHVRTRNGERKTATEAAALEQLLQEALRPE